jgi:hypothetical protein
MTLYVVEALRYGDRERHSYVVGVYDTLDGAKDAAEAEVNDRGGKYTCEVTAHPINGGTANAKPLVYSYSTEKV